MTKTKMFMEAISQIGLTKLQQEAVSNLFTVCFEGQKINSPASKDRVKQFQRYLISLGIKINPDGVYGTDTLKAALTAMKSPNVNDEAKKKIRNFMVAMRQGNAMADVLNGSQQQSKTNQLLAQAAHDASVIANEQLAKVTSLKKSNTANA